MIIPENDRLQKNEDWLRDFKFKLNNNSYRSPRNESGDRNRGDRYDQRRRNNNHHNRSSYDNHGRCAHWEDDRSRGRDSPSNDYEEFMRWKDSHAVSYRRGCRDFDFDNGSTCPCDGHRDQEDDRDDNKRHRATMFCG